MIRRIHTSSRLEKFFFFFLLRDLKSWVIYAAGDRRIQIRALSRYRKKLRFSAMMMELAMPGPQ